MAYTYTGKDFTDYVSPASPGTPLNEANLDPNGLAINEIQALYGKAGAGAASITGTLATSGALTISSGNLIITSGGITIGSKLGIEPNAYWGTYFQLGASAGSFADWAMLDSTTACIAYVPTGTKNFAFCDAISSLGKASFGGAGTTYGLNTKNASGSAAWAQFENYDFVTGSVGSSLQFYASGASGNVASNVQAIQSGSGIAALNLNPSGGDVTTGGEFASGSNTYVPAAAARIFGSGAQEGDWRWIREGNDLVAQRLESSVWTTKGTISA